MATVPEGALMEKYKNTQSLPSPESQETMEDQLSIPAVVSQEDVLSASTTHLSPKMDGQEDCHKVILEQDPYVNSTSSSTTRSEHQSTPTRKRSRVPDDRILQGKSREDKSQTTVAPTILSTPRRSPRKLRRCSLLSPPAVKQSPRKTPPSPQPSRTPLPPSTTAEIIGDIPHKQSNPLILKIRLQSNGATKATTTLASPNVTSNVQPPTSMQRPPLAPGSDIAGAATPPALEPLIVKRKLKADGTPLKKNKSTAITNPPSPESPLTSFPKAMRFDPSQVRTHMNKLFGQQPHRTGDICVAPCLFAAFSLYRQQQHQDDDVPASKRQRGHKTSAELEPILEFLQALVELEVAVFRGNHTPSSVRSTRRVHFAAYDGSALLPPSDVLEGSHKAQEAVIENLRNVIQISSPWIEAGRQEDATSSKRPDHILLLQELHCYLESPLFQMVHANLCANTLSPPPGQFPVERIQKAAAAYADDFQAILSYCNCPSENNHPPPSWHCRLTHACAQNVRYWLRTELNPVPDRAPSESYSELWNCRVSDLVELGPPEDEDDLYQGATTVAVEDGSLSSLVSDAASHIYHYVGDDCTKWRALSDGLPEDFCNSDLCQRGIAPTDRRRSPSLILPQMTLEDWRHVEENIEAATGYLAACNSAQFLLDLLAIVLDHPEHLKSWRQTIEKASKVLHASCDASATCEASLPSQDAHLRLLRWPPGTLVDQLPLLIDESRRSASCKGLKRLAKKFCFGTPKRASVKSIRRKRVFQPHVGRAEQLWEQAVSKSVFPTLQLE